MLCFCFAGASHASCFHSNEVSSPSTCLTEGQLRTPHGHFREAQYRVEWMGSRWGRALTHVNLRYQSHHERRYCPPNIATSFPPAFAVVAPTQISTTSRISEERTPSHPSSCKWNTALEKIQSTTNHSHVLWEPSVSTCLQLSPKPKLISLNVTT